MADTVTVRKFFEGTRRFAVHLTGISDGTGETAVVKVSKAALLANDDGEAVSRIVIDEITWSVDGHAYVNLLWDHTTDQEIAVLERSGYKSFLEFGGLVDPNTAGGTGDIILTVGTPVAGGSYDILLNCRKKYD